MAVHLIAGCVQQTKTFYHSGDLGDIIYSLPAIRAIGGGILYLGPDGCKAMLPRQPMTRDRFESIAPLIRAQPYIHGCEYRESAAGVDHNLNEFKYDLMARLDTAPGMNLARVYLHRLRLPLDLDADPWLAAEPHRRAAVVIARSDRYHGDFDWNHVLQTYSGEIGFVGLPSEHKAFCEEFGNVPHLATNDILDLAQVIAGADLFIGNQSCPFALAVGIGKAAVLENTSISNTIFRRKNIAFGCSHGTALPELPPKPKPALSLDDITVVITNFQRAGFLRIAFDSCITAGLRNIVITSSGTTTEVEKIHTYAKSTNSKTIIISETGDSGSNTNWLRGVEAAKTKWVQILHDDDKILPNYASIIPYLSGVDFACWDGGTHGFSDGKTCQLFQRVSFGKHSTGELLPHILAKPLSPSPVSGCFQREHLVKTLRICSEWGPEFVLKNGLLVGNDLLIWLMAVRDLKSFHYIPKPITSYGFHPDSATVSALSSNDSRLAGIYARVRDLFSRGQIPQPKPRSLKPQLITVTIVGIDNLHPLRTLRAMRQAASMVDVAGSALVTSPQHAALITGVTVLPLIAGLDRPSREQFMIKRITESFNTSYCLHIEWDAGILNPKAWDNAWLKYDFIGAPWPHPHSFPGFPPCTKERCVGNFGFSLISKRFADALAIYSKPVGLEGSQFSDVYVCMKLRPQLEAVGLRFAPEEVAAAFSCEARPYKSQFGWHGQVTARDNNFLL